MRENFADELKAQRKYAQERVGLVVVVDGDVQGVAARKKQLDDAAINAGLQKRKKSERVAICVPTRNIETWVVAICRDGDFNETDDYKQTVTPEEYRKAPRIWLGNENACPLPSCLDARQEFTRLDGQRP
ncbi:MAG: hypothetical protein JXA30_19625 [Deltaproteobacteria bacterium]|nr:hypothetical protein [Deltaproteobacteria bacterium]